MLPTAALPLDNVHDNIDGWNSVMLDPDEEGSSRLVSDIEKYSMAFLNSADIRENEDFPDFYDANDNTMMIHSESNAMTMTAMKTTPETLNLFGSRHFLSMTLNMINSCEFC